MSRSRVIGDIKLRKMLREIHKTADNLIKPAMQESASRILSDMRTLVPKDTGHGADELSAFVSKSGLDAQVGIRGKRTQERAFYLRFLEYGTKGYSGKSYRRKGKFVTRSKKKKYSYRADANFGRYPDIPARRARPWLRPSYDMNRETVRHLISAAITETLRRAAR